MSTHEATTQQPLLLATDLKKYYPVKKGLFAPERTDQGAGRRLVYP